ncbi:MAG: segregation/condensation protein A [Phycisphaerales bacterium]|nr:MAG: segregation/condensation protein A [Phycisphaerales bacterium]
MADYRVNLDIFAGPLDLLLYLVRKEEVDIYDIPLAKITDQYLHYVEMLKQFDVDLAGDFLVMAATLMEIKSAMLLPKAEPEEMTAEEAADPRAELIRQLLEYKKFKDAANLLEAAAEQQKERFGRPTSLIDRLEPDAEPELDMDQVSVWDLLEAFDTVCKAIGTTTYTGHIKDDTPIDLYQIEILHRLQTEGPLTFERIFESRPNRLVMIGRFLAMLELIRDKLIWAEQGEGFPHQIYLRALTDEPAELAVQKAILTVDEGADAGPSRMEAPQYPPIPIKEIPASSQPQAPEPQSDEPERQEAHQSESLDDTDPQASEDARSDSSTPAVTRNEPPIPIAELPPKAKPEVDQPDQEEAAQKQAEASEDNLPFDNPLSSP